MQESCRIGHAQWLTKNRSDYCESFPFFTWFPILFGRLNNRLENMNNALSVSCAVVFFVQCWNFSSVVCTEVCVCGVWSDKKIARVGNEVSHVLEINIQKK